MSIREGMVLSAHEVVLQTIFLKAFKSMSFSKLILSDCITKNTLFYVSNINMVDLEMRK